MTATIRQPGMTNAEYLRVLRQLAIADGKCYQCRCRPAKQGARYCTECLERTAAYNKSVRYLLCLRCGSDVAGLGRQHCETCSSRIRERTSAVRAQRVVDGQCSLCPGNANRGQTMCLRCLERLRLRALATNRSNGARPDKHRCSICSSLGMPGLAHNKTTHTRYMELAKQWRAA